MKSIIISLLCLCFILTNSNNALAQRKHKKANKQSTAHKKQAKTQKHQRVSSPAKPLVRDNSAVNDNALNKAANAEINVDALQDTNTIKAVTITSVFKPTLRKAAKINFSAAAAIADTIRVPLTYQIPTQNLFFKYQPVPLKPLSLLKDSTLPWQQEAYVKVGYGNYNTLFVEAAATIKHNDKNDFQFFVNHLASNGSLQYQDFSKTNFYTNGNFKLSNNNLLTSKFSINNFNQYQYGFDKSLSFDKQSLQRGFTTVSFENRFENTQPNRYGILYKPSLDVYYLSDNFSHSEWSIAANAALSKTLSSNLKLNMAFVADFTSFTAYANSYKMDNNLFYFNSNFQTNYNDIDLMLGVKPGWDADGFFLLPNLSAKYKMPNSAMSFEAGYIGNSFKNNYRTLSHTNPFIAVPTMLHNTLQKDLFVQIKSSLRKHIAYSGGVGFTQWNNLPVLIQDSTKGNTQSYFSLFEDNLSAIKLFAEASYLLQDKWQAAAGFKYYIFTGQASYSKPYGLLPLELNATTTYHYSKELGFKADMFLFDGAYYSSVGASANKQPLAIDLNIATQFNLIPRLDIWMQLNNLLGSNYQRWNSYPVLGLNVLAGVKYSFK